MTDASERDLAELRRDVAGWLDASDLGAPTDGPATLDGQVEQYLAVRRALWDADWGRLGWPERVGGLGGPGLLRAVVAEEVAARRLADPGCWSMIEVLAPTLIATAPPGLAAEVVPALLRGDTMWCQGFSEPGAGSDLASLACRAVADGDHWVVTGQKVWTSYAQYARHCVLLTRTGEPGSAHRGITALFVDMDTPGIEVRPLETQHGRAEFSEVFYDGARVPRDRVLGEVGGGWAVAMDILPNERSTTFWARGAHLLRRCDDLVQAMDGDGGEAALGAAYQALIAFRTRSMATQRRLAAGESLGAETSIDKVLIATAEQALFDAARDLLPGRIELDGDREAEVWREDYLYARAATIYGGTGEIQRSIIARRLLDLGPEG